MDGVITHSLFKIMCIMSLFGYEATPDLKLLCRSVIMQVLFPAAFITQQIVPVSVHWFLPCKLCTYSSFYHEKIFSFPPPFLCFSTLLLFSLNCHHHHFAFSFYDSDFNFYAMHARIFATWLYCFYCVICRDPGEGGAKGALASPLFYLVLLKHKPNVSFTFWTICKLHFSLFVLFLLFETFKPKFTFAPHGFKERLNFNSKTLCSQFLSRNRLFLDDCFPEWLVLCSSACFLLSAPFFAINIQNG